MKKSRTMLFGIFLSILLVVTPLSASAASKTVAVETQAVTMKFDGQALALPNGQVAFTYQSRVYIPLRFVSYALLKSVAWDGAKSQVTVSEPTSAQAVSLQELLMNSAALAKSKGGKTPASGKVNVTPVNVKFVFDGAEKKLPAGQQAFSLNGTIYVPVRFMSESVGAVINWDAKTKSVIGQSKSNQDGNQGSNGGSGGTGTGGGSSGTDGTETGSGGGGASAPQTLESIKAQTQKSLENLRDSCINSILALVDKYEGKELKDQATKKLSSCQASFESIMSSTQSKLKAINVSDDVIQSTLQGYRDTYNAELDYYRKLAEQYLG